jgi:putative nucleotidyltransferase with HDIG domain
MVTLEELIRQAQEMRPLPASAVRLAALINSPTVDLNEVADIIAYDQALTMRLLRAVNSAATASSARVTHAVEAVFRLGTARVVSLAIAASVRDPFQRDVSAYGLGDGQLWRHSVATAVVAEVLCESSTLELPGDTFTAALLHDVGKLVMGRHMRKEDLDRLHRAKAEGGLNALEAERQILGVHHGELGGIVARHWQLPERVVLGVIQHHTPTDGFDLVCDAVCLSNLVASHIDIGGPLRLPPADSLERLEMTQAAVEKLAKAARARFVEISARYNAV